MKKISLATPKIQITENDGNAYIHPICALSFPNIYQLGGPANMNFKLCSNIDPNEIKKMPVNPKICDFCSHSTPRMIKCQEYDKFKKTAHAFCIMDRNKELVYQVDALQHYQYEDKMPIKWNFQLFFKDTYDSQRSCFEKRINGSQVSQDSSSGAHNTKEKI